MAPSLRTSGASQPAGAPHTWLLQEAHTGEPLDCSREFTRPAGSLQPCLACFAAREGMRLWLRGGRKEGRWESERRPRSRGGAREKAPLHPGSEGAGRGGAPRAGSRAKAARAWKRAAGLRCSVTTAARIASPARHRATTSTCIQNWLNTTACTLNPKP